MDGFSRGIPSAAYTPKYPIPASRAPCATVAYTVREECDERTGEYRENEAGKDRDPLQQNLRADGVAEVIDATLTRHAAELRSGVAITVSQRATRERNLPLGPPSPAWN